MNKKRIAQYCCAALVASGIGLNIQNALSDYGISENSLSLIAVPGSGSGSNSNSNSNSNTNWDSNSDSNWDSNDDTNPEPIIFKYDCVPHTFPGDEYDEEKHVLNGDTPPEDGEYSHDEFSHGEKVGEVWIIPLREIWSYEMCEWRPDGEYNGPNCNSECASITLTVEHR